MIAARFGVKDRGPGGGRLAAGDGAQDLAGQAR